MFWEEEIRIFIILYVNDTVLVNRFIQRGCDYLIRDILKILSADCVCLTQDFIGLFKCFGNVLFYDYLWYNLILIFHNFLSMRVCLGIVWSM